MNEGRLKPRTPRGRFPAIRRTFLLCLAGLLLWGCAEQQPPHRNLIFISIDTLRADRLGCYGYDRPTSPFMDRFAASGILFKNTVAQSPWTLPSHASMLTGRYPHGHGVVDEWKSLPADVPTLASVLQDEGFATAAYVNSYWLTGEMGMDQGFQTFEFFSEDLKGAGETITERGLAWLDQRRPENQKPFFLFLHYYDVHTPFFPKPAFRKLFLRPYSGKADGSTEQLMDVREGKLAYDEADIQRVSDLYDAGIRQFDALLEGLYGQLQQRGILENTVLVLTADHGEEFMEHGGVLHGRTLYREMLDIPLMLQGPGIPKGLVDEGLTQSVDLMPTLLGLLGIDYPGRLDGVDLFQDPEKNRTDRLALAEADWRNEKPNIKQMIQSLEYKLCYNHLTQEMEFYDLKADTLEKRNLAKEQAELAGQWLERLLKFGRSGKEGQPVLDRSEEDIKRLEALGY